MNEVDKKIVDKLLSEAQRTSFDAIFRVITGASSLGRAFVPLLEHASSLVCSKRDLPKSRAVRMRESSVFVCVHLSMRGDEISLLERYFLCASSARLFGWFSTRTRKSRAIFACAGYTP